MSESTPLDQQVMAQWFEKYYHCPICDTEWTDEWSCLCNDKCPNCNAEIEPFDSVDLSRPLTKEDYLGAARLIFGSSDASASDVTDDEARQYAEAILERDEHRFMPTPRDR
jgi:hypothetical protein